MLPLLIARSPQLPGLHRSHLRPPTPGLQTHCRVWGSQLVPYDPRGLHWQEPEKTEKIKETF